MTWGPGEEALADAWSPPRGGAARALLPDDAAGVRGAGAARAAGGRRRHRAAPPRLRGRGRRWSGSTVPPIPRATGRSSPRTWWCARTPLLLARATAGAARRARRRDGRRSASTRCCRASTGAWRARGREAVEVRVSRLATRGLGWPWCWPRSRGLRPLALLGAAVACAAARRCGSGPRATSRRHGGWPPAGPTRTPATRSTSAARCSASAWRPRRRAPGWCWRSAATSPPSIRPHREEPRFLREKFGAEYAAWAAEVPVFLPRPSPGGPRSSRFSWDRVRANREWRTLLALPALAMVFWVRSRF